jgi:hypothetical protein
VTTHIIVGEPEGPVIETGQLWRLLPERSRDGRAYEVLITTALTDRMWNVIFWPEGEGMESAEAAGTWMLETNIWLTCRKVRDPEPGDVEQIKAAYEDVHAAALARFEARQREKAG